VISSPSIASFFDEKPQANRENSWRSSKHHFRNRDSLPTQTKVRDQRFISRVGG
jgi:hypothetical protein